MAGVGAGGVLKKKCMRVYFKRVTAGAGAGQGCCNNSYLPPYNPPERKRKKAALQEKNEAIMASLKQISRRLQTALCQQGRYIKINQYQTYSDRQKRMVTKYVLQETRGISTGKQKAVTILETYQLADVVKKLAAIYNGGDAD